LSDTSTASLDSSDVEGDIAGGDTEKSFGGSSESSSLKDAVCLSPPDVSASITHQLTRSFHAARHRAADALSLPSTTYSSPFRHTYKEQPAVRSSNTATAANER